MSSKRSPTPHWMQDGARNGAAPAPGGVCNLHEVRDLLMQRRQGTPICPLPSQLQQRHSNRNGNSRPPRGPSPPLSSYQCSPSLRETATKGTPQPYRTSNSAGDSSGGRPQSRTCHSGSGGCQTPTLAEAMLYTANSMMAAERRLRQEDQRRYSPTTSRRHSFLEQAESPATPCHLTERRRNSRRCKKRPSVGSPSAAAPVGGCNRGDGPAARPLSPSPPQSSPPLQQRIAVRAPPEDRHEVLSLTDDPTQPCRALLSPESKAALWARQQHLAMGHTPTGVPQLQNRPRSNPLPSDHYAHTRRTDTKDLRSPMQTSHAARPPRSSTRRPSQLALNGTLSQEQLTNAFYRTHRGGALAAEAYKHFLAQETGNLTHHPRAPPLKPRRRGRLTSSTARISAHRCALLDNDDGSFKDGGGRPSAQPSYYYTFPVLQPQQTMARIHLGGVRS